MAEERLQPISLHQEMQRSYLEYAMSVIVGRALPDARDGLKPVQRRILIGTYALSAGYSDAYYKKAQKVRTLIRKDFDNAFKKVDVLLTPTCPTTAFLKGDFVNDPLSMYLSDLLTVPANLAGLPAISIPCGFDTKGLPIGVQLIGNVLEEDRILNAANIFEIDAQVIKNRPLF